MKNSALTLTIAIASLLPGAVFAQGQGGPAFNSAASSGYGGQIKTICYQGQTIQVNSTELGQYMRNGAKMGACTSNNAAPGSISGTTYSDFTGSGKNFQGLLNRRGGITVFLDTNNDGNLNAGEPSTQSSIFGNYSFANLPANTTYHVREVTPAGSILTFAPEGVYHQTLASGQNIAHNDFANRDPNRNHWWNF